MKVRHQGHHRSNKSQDCPLPNTYKRNRQFQVQGQEWDERKIQHLQERSRDRIDEDWYVSDLDQTGS